MKLVDASTAAPESADARSARIFAIMLRTLLHVDFCVSIVEHFKVCERIFVSTIHIMLRKLNIILINCVTNIQYFFLYLQIFSQEISEFV